MTACRVCGSPRLSYLGAVEYLEGYRAPVYDCAECGCRLTPHDTAVHQRFHREPALSYYNDYAGLAERCRALSAAGDHAGLRRELSREAKNRFIVDRLASIPSTANLLEVGCSRGYLTSLFIMEQRSILGVDVSREAIDAARAAFGPHFAVTGDAAVRARAPYDVIYHLGLIGCVADPIAFTRELLRMLHPCGVLLFNAPNRAALRWANQLWLDSAPPPDLVTLFPDRFWPQFFGQEADVRVDVATMNASESLAIAAKQAMGVKWLPPDPQPFSVRGHAWSQPGGARVFAAGAVAKAATLLGASALAVPRPAEFGMFVQLSPKVS